MRTLVAIVLAATLLLGTAQAQDPSQDPAQAVNGTVGQAESLLDRTLDGVGDAADGVGDAAEKTGDGVGKGASAIGEALVAVGKAIGKAAAATGKAVGAAATAGAKAITATGLASSLGVSGGLLAVGGLGGDALAGLGGVAAAGIAFAGLAIGDVSVLAAHLVGNVASLYAGFVGGLRPDAMSSAVFATVAITGTAATTGVGGWAGWAALKKWGWAGSAGIAGFSRIADDDLLEHPLRAQVFQVIQSNPGIHASGLARQVGVGWGTITHHLEKLEKGHLVATRKINNQKCFFENGGSVSRLDMNVAGAVKGDTASDIAQYVLGHPMTSQKDMAAALGISPALVSFHVKKLTNLGVLDKVRHGKETLLTTSEALRRVLAAEKSPAAHLEQKDESFSYTS